MKGGGKNKRKEKSRDRAEEGIDGRLVEASCTRGFPLDVPPLPVILFFSPVMKANASSVGANRAYLAPG